MTDEIWNLKAVPAQGSVKLTWGVTSTNYLVGFDVVVTLDGQVFQRINNLPPTAREYTVTGLDPTGKTRYAFNVRADVEQGGRTVEATPLAPPPPPPPPPSAETWQGYTASNPMPAGVRPGNASSPFNLPVGPSPTVLANSAVLVAFLLTDGGGGPADRVRPEGGSRPMYYAANTDPVVELVATENWGVNPLTGRKIRVPVDATAEEQSDGHLTIVLAPLDAKVPGETADLWIAKPVSAGKLSFAWGGPGNMTGTLLQPEGPSADAANYDLQAGLIRAPELKAGVIPHAITAVVDHVKPSFVYPASHTDGTSNEPGAPAMGQRFYLDYSIAEIKALGFKPWKTAILEALADYGFYIGDSGNNNLTLLWEGSLTYPDVSPEPFAAIGAEQGVPESGGSYIFKLAEGIDWTRLRAIAPPA